MSFNPPSMFQVQVKSEDFLYGNPNNSGYTRNVDFNTTFQSQENVPFQYGRDNHEKYSFSWNSYNSNIVKNENSSYESRMQYNHFYGFNNTQNSQGTFNASQHSYTDHEMKHNNRKRKREDQHQYDYGNF